MSKEKRCTSCLVIITTDMPSWVIMLEQRTTNHPIVPERRLIARFCSERHMKDYVKEFAI